MSTRGFVGYTTGGKIRGWYNHSDSYPSYLGEILLEKFCSMSQDQLRHFFTECLHFTKTEPVDDCRHRIRCDWTSEERVQVKEASSFLMEPIWCEFAYVFDLSGPQKSLMLFRGFSDSPTPGYEDLMEVGHDGVKFYNNLSGRIPDGLSFQDAFVLMNLLLITRTSYKIHLIPDEKVPLIRAMLPDMVDDEDEIERIESFLPAYMELRLKGVLKQGELPCRKGSPRKVA